MDDDQIMDCAECDGFFYLASPYSQYYLGTEAAFIEASKCAAWLMKRGVSVFAPIAHSHPIAVHGRIPLADHDIWLPADVPFMRAAAGLIVCCMPGWKESVGVHYEINFFTLNDKPIYYLEWPRDA